MKKLAIDKILKDARATKGTRKRDKEIEELRGMLKEAEAYAAYTNDPDATLELYIARAYRYRRLAIAGWLVALIVSLAFIWTNIDAISYLITAYSNIKYRFY